MTGDPHTTSSDSGSESSGATPTAADRAAVSDALRAGFSGLNAWLVVYLLPSLWIGEGSATEAALAAVPLVVLLVGVAAVGSGRPWGHPMLLAVFPPALGGLLVLSPRLGAVAVRDAADVVGLSLGVASLTAFVAAVAYGAAHARAAKPSSAHPLIGKAPVSEPFARRGLRRLLLTAVGLGGFFMLVVAPSLTSPRERVALWGEGAADGAVLTAVVATIVTCLALGAVVGPGLRADRRRSSARQTRRRVGAALLIAALGAAAFLVLASFDAAR